MNTTYNINERILFKDDKSVDCLVKIVDIEDDNYVYTYIGTFQNKHKFIEWNDESKTILFKKKILEFNELVENIKK